MYCILLICMFYYSLDTLFHLKMQALLFVKHVLIANYILEALLLSDKL